MKIKEIRLYKVKIIENDTVIFEDVAEKIPQELKEREIVSIELDAGEAVINL